MLEGHSSRVLGFGRGDLSTAQFLGLFRWRWSGRSNPGGARTDNRALLSSLSAALLLTCFGAHGETPFPLPWELLSERAQLLAPQPWRTNTQFGASIAIAEQTMVVGSPEGTVLGERVGVAYVFERGNEEWLEQARLFVGDRFPGQRFGRSVAIDGTGSLLAVGAPGDTEQGDGVGSVYVFVKAGNGWRQQAKLTAAGLGADQGFGDAVAISGETLFVGVPRGTSAVAADSGAVYVFARNGSEWLQQARWTAIGAAAGDLFGTSLSLEGDRAVVGAPGKQGSIGAVYFFQRTGEAWVDLGPLMVQDDKPVGRFGESVAMSGDTLVVGAPNHLDPQGSGSTYVYAWNGTAWTQQEKLHHIYPDEYSDSTPGAGFGRSVAFDGNTVVVGEANGRGDRSGAVYLYSQPGHPGLNAWNVTDRTHLTTGSVTYTHNLTASETLAAASSGWQLSVHSRLVYDYSRQDTRTMMFFYGNGLKRYLVYLDFDEAGGLIAELSTPSGLEVFPLVPGGAGADAYHDHEVRFDPDTGMATYSFDGTPIHEWSGQASTSRGVTWGSGSTPGRGTMNYHRVQFEILGPTPTVAASYDAGAAGNPVVAPDPATQDWNPGLPTDPQQLFFWRPVSPDGGRWQEQAQFGPNDWTDGLTFGESVAIRDGWVAVGIPYRGTFEFNRDWAQTYRRSGVRWTTAQGVEGGYDSGVGRRITVAAAEDIAVIGIPLVDHNSTDSGVVEVYRRTGADWSGLARLVLEDAGYHEEFGRNLAISGSTLVVAARDAREGPPPIRVFSVRESEVILESTIHLEGLGPSTYIQGLAVDDDRLVVRGFYYDPATVAFVHVYRRDATSWIREAALLPESSPSGLSWGGSTASAVSLSGDTLVIGAPFTGMHGAAFVYAWKGATWEQEVILDGSGQESFGQAVCIHDDTIIVGAPYALNRNGKNSGAVHILQREGGGWTRLQRLEPDTGFPNLDFGEAVAFDGETVAVGAPAYSEGVDDSGVVYLFTRGDALLWGQNRILLPGELIESQDAGRSVALGRDVVLFGTSNSSDQRSRAYLWTPNYLDDSAVAQYALALTDYTIASQSPEHSAESAAFRYKDLLYGPDAQDPESRIRSQLEDIRSLYGSAERDRAGEAERVIRHALVLEPENATLSNHLLDLHYDRMAAEAILVQDLLAQANLARLGPPSTPGGFVMDDEITLYQQALATNRVALEIYFSLLTDDLGLSAEPPLGFQIFQQRVPGRALEPATYRDTDGTAQPVTRDPSPLANGYKDLILLLDLLRQHGRAAVASAQMLYSRDGPGDRAEARTQIEGAEQFLFVQGNVLLGVFPEFTPVDGDGSGLTEAIAGWNEALNNLIALEHTIASQANPLGFESDFFMYVQKFTGEEEVFDSYDALKVRLLPTNEANPLGSALDRLDRARASHGTYRGFQDQLALQFAAVTGTVEDRLFELVGAYPGDPVYDTPQNNEGSEIWQQLQSLEAARLRIERNRAEVHNLRREIQIEIDRATDTADVVIRYGNQQAELTKTIGQLEAAQEAAGTLGGISADPVSIAAAIVSAGMTAGLGVEKAELQAEKERLAALEQAEIEGLNSAAQVKTMLLRMNTLVIDSQEAALLYRQEHGRLTSLFREKANLEQSSIENNEDLANRYFADPVHRLQTQHDTLLANLSFAEAQKWLYFLVRALEYKWNSPFQDFPFQDQSWSASTLFRLRNAEELERFYLATDAYESQIQLPKDDYFDWFSLRDDFFGYKPTNSAGEPQSHVDPHTGETVGALEAFRRALRRHQDEQGNIQLDFSTVREIPGGTFFRGPRFTTTGQLISKGLTLDKIRWIKINLPGAHSLGRSQLTGELRYGGTSFIRNFDAGRFDPDRPDRLRDEMTTYSTRFWYFHAPSNTWRFTDYLSSPVTMQLSSDPRVPPSVQEIDVFKERSVATTGWFLSIPTSDLNQDVLDIDELDDIELYIYHYAVTRP